MNYPGVPDFFLEDEELNQQQQQEKDQIQQQPNRLSSYDEELFEILWQKEPLVQKLTDADRLQPIAAGRSDTSGGASTSTAAEVLIQEDEMFTWLQYDMSGAEIVEGRERLYGEFLKSSPDLAAEGRMVPEETMTDRSSGDSARTRTDRMSETEQPGIVSPPEASGSVQQVGEVGKDKHKRKGTVDAEFGSTEKKKNTCKLARARRKRAAEVHNLSERRRRDRINEKIKALQQLIPRCNKSDIASTLDEAIEYVKALQLQVQMMSVGSNMPPIMYPGMQPYLPSPGMRMNNMGMGLGMPMQGYLPPFGHLFLGSQIPGLSTVHAGSRLFIPSMQQPGVPLPDQYPVQASITPDSSILENVHGSSASHVPNASEQHTNCPSASSACPQNLVVTESRDGKDTTSTIRE